MFNILEGNIISNDIEKTTSYDKFIKLESKKF